MNNLANLLIVDDTEVNLNFLEAIVRNLNVNLIQAISGNEALEKTRELDLALAIIDVRMPEMGGFELAVKINERSRLNVPVIFLTANHLVDEDVISGYNSGAVDYLSKPISRHILLCKIKVFLDLFYQKQLVLSDALIMKKKAKELMQVNSALALSERRLSDIIFSMVDWVWEINESAFFKYSSNRGSELLGFPNDEIIGKTPFDFMQPEEAERVALEFSSCMKKKIAIKDLENWNIRRNGEQICFLTNGVPFYDEKGNFQGYRGVVKDITERKYAEAVLQEREKEYRSYIDNAPDGVFVVDESGRYLEVNEAACRITEFSKEELLSMSIVDILPEESIELGRSQFKQVVNEGFGSTEIIFKTKGGEKRWWSISATKLSDTRLLGFTKDITLRKKLEEKLISSETNFRTFFETLDNFVIVGNRQGKIIYTNEVVSKKLGYSEEELLSMHVLELNPPTMRAEAEQIFADIKEGKRDVCPLPLIRKDETRIPVETRVWFGKWDGNDCVFGISEDITERIMAEQSLKLSEEKYRTMLNASPDGIFLIDLNGIITDVSEIGVELFGFDNKSELIGEQFSHFINAEEKKTYAVIIEKTLNEGIAQNIEVGIRRKNQMLFLSEVSSTFMQGLDGKQFSFMIIIRDISQRKKSETKQIHADRMANLGEMASGMAHEINQPLNIISMVMDKILFETAKTESINVEFLKSKSDKIFENISRIRNIIDHVRSFSRSQDAYISSAFDINTSIENALSMISEQFKHMGVNLQLKLERSIPLILGNTYNFEQVIINLLTNAKDALLEKKNRQKEFEEMVIEIKTFQLNQSLVVEIADNGIGIENADFHNVMLPFYTTKEEGKGTGLGLTICYQIIKEMGGSIDITSTRYEGTKIRLKLDVRKEIGL